MKTEILKMLRETEGYVSGQELCNKFGVSRTAIWKVINQLKEMNADHEFQRIRLSAAFAFTVIRAYQRFQVLPRNDAV